MKKIDISDVLIFLGLGFLSYGLFLWFGEAVSLSVIGGIILMIGLYSAGIGTKRKE